MLDTQPTGDELFAALEADMSEERYRGQPLRKLAEIYACEGRDQKLREMQWEMLAFDLVPGGGGHDRLFANKWFGPMMSGQSKQGQPMRYPDEDSFAPEVLAYYSRRAAETANPIHKARYCDVLWEATRDHQAARAAIRAHLDCVPAYLDSDWGHELRLALRRALTLSVQLRDNTLQGAVVDAAGAALATLQARQNYSRYSEPLCALLDVGASAESIDWPTLLPFAIEASAHFASEGTFARQRQFLQIAARIHREAEQSQEASRMRAEAAESLVQEAEQRRARGEHLVASKFLRDALELYTEAGSGGEVLDRVKVRLEEAGRQAVSAMKQITSGPIEIPRDVIEAIPSQMRPMSLPMCFRALSRYEGWIPSADRARRTAAENAGRFISQMMPLTVFRGDIPALEIVEDSARVEYEALNLIKMTYQVFAEAHLPAIIEVLREKGWTAEAFAEHLSHGGLISESRLRLIKHGADRYFADDTVSALHILVLQVEGIVRDAAAVLGLPTTTRRGGRVQARMLDSLLEDEDIVAVLGCDFSTLPRVFLTDPQGDSLRNDVAHALLDPDSFDRWKCELLVMILLRLSAYQVDRISSGDAAPRAEGARPGMAE
jgi:hypothetical protein